MVVNIHGIISHIPRSVYLPSQAPFPMGMASTCTRLYLGGADLEVFGMSSTFCDPKTWAHAAAKTRGPPLQYPWNHIGVVCFYDI